jgi:phage-related protein
MRRVSWLKTAWREFEDFPESVRRQIAFGLDRAAEGGKADNAKAASWTRRRRIRGER